MRKIDIKKIDRTKYTQLCIWPGTVVERSNIEAFEKGMKETFGVRVLYEDEIKTLPDKDQWGQDVPETGGRNDLFFYVHHNDVTKFAVPRLKVGIRWWEDVLGNGGGRLYTEEVLLKYPPTWDY